MQQQRVEFWQLVRGILAKDVIFIDESGVNLAMVRFGQVLPKDKGFLVDVQAPACCLAKP